MMNDRDLEHLLSVTEEYEYVSLDLFDTLIFRTFSEPGKLYEAVEKYAAGGGITLKGFEKKRIKAESAARKKNNYNEITIDDIYKQLKMDDISKKHIMSIEKMIEVSTCVPNDCMVEFVRFCVQRGQKIIVTTDMYLDRNTIDGILLKIGMKPDWLFISGEIGKTKLSGELFQHILSELGIKKENICHIGDNPKTDIDMAKKNGIDAFMRIDRRDKIHYSADNIVANNIFELYQNYYLQQNGYTLESEIGYTVIGPLMYSFCKWIHDMGAAESKAVLGFVAREGYLIKQIYELMYPKETNCRYIRINKNTVRLPGLATFPSVDQFISTIPYRKTYTGNDILELLMIENKKLFVSSLDVEFDLKMQFSWEDLRSEWFRKMFHAIVKLLDKRMKQQIEYLIRYYKNINDGFDTMYLINNSANGSAQKSLETILDKMKVEHKIVGIQFVASEKCRDQMKGKFLKWIDDDILSKYENEMFSQYSILFEHLLFKAEGTAKKYCQDCDEIKVICDSDEDGAQNEKIIKEIQDSAKQFALHYQNYGVLNIKTDAIKRLIRLELQPSKEAALLLGKIVDKDYCGFSPLFHVADYEGKSFHYIKKCCNDYNEIKWPHGLFAALDYNSCLRYYNFEKKVKYYIKNIVRK